MKPYQLYLSIVALFCLNVGIFTLVGKEFGLDWINLIGIYFLMTSVKFINGVIVNIWDTIK